MLADPTRNRSGTENHPEPERIPPGLLWMGAAAVSIFVAATWWAAGHSTSADPFLASGPSRVRWILGLSGIVSSLGSGPVRAAVVGVAIARLASSRRWLAIAYLLGVLIAVGAGGRLAKSTVHRARPTGMERGYALAPSIRIVVILAVLGVGCIALRRIGPSVIVLVSCSYLAVVALARGVSTIRLTVGQDSFPSGHAGNTMAILAALTLVQPAGKRRSAITFIGLVLVLLVGVSRVTLGFHHPVDVVGGWSLAVACAIGGRLVLDRIGFASSSPGSA